MDQGQGDFIHFGHLAESFCLCDSEDPHRVLDYRGGQLMAVGSKDRAVHIFSLGFETKVLRVMKGHVGIIREVLLCEERDLAITASSDASIRWGGGKEELDAAHDDEKMFLHHMLLLFSCRCWNLKTDRCVMALYGHTGTVNCLDVYGDRLVSGSKDRLVKGQSVRSHQGVLRLWSAHSPQDTTAMFDHWQPVDQMELKTWFIKHIFIVIFLLP